ncbi:sulfur carrier protein ThiS [Amphritea sp.]|uniref:sulfur carrier protein ThiS n=1 Tax=Amphritea sp. TaxID=1872502 RepID=UPI003A8E180A
MIHITVNGEQMQWASSKHLQELIDALELTGKRIAVEVNQEVIPQSQHSNTHLSSDDRIEIVTAIGGG